MHLQKEIYMKDEYISSYYSRESYHETVTQLRTFFLKRGYQEIDTQSRFSILAACEDPKTIATFEFDGIKWPLPQTGQMWLEDELLQNPHVPGLFCLTTSYRNEPNPDKNRHLKVFPLFEFETKGDMKTLQILLEDLFEYLGFGDKSLFRDGNYNSIASYYGVDLIETEQEKNIAYDFSSVFILKNFPFRSNPYFNMKKVGNIAKKIDAIIYGVETVGSAERSCNPEEMKELFYTTSNGQYAELLFKHFGQSRVKQELDEFLSHNFFPRCGGGIGVHRLMRGIQLSKMENPSIHTSQYNNSITKSYLSP